MIVVFFIIIIIIIISLYHVPDELGILFLENVDEFRFPPLLHIYRLSSIWGALLSALFSLYTVPKTRDVEFLLSSIV